MPTYMLRPDATRYLRKTHGIPLGNDGLSNMASDDVGPEYAIINGRALYTREALDAWALNKGKRRSRRRSSGRQQQPAA